MKVLESAPDRYDRGIRMLTLGRVDRAYDRLAAHIAPGQRVLDIGCGTGALSLRAAQKGATVKGIDVNAQMLEIARQRVEAADLAGAVELCEMGVAELNIETPASYDVVTSGLCFSELTGGERSYALDEAHRVLKPGGLLLLADEVMPRSLFRWLLHWLIRLPLIIITYMLTQTTTRAIRDLPEQVRAAGFTVESIHLSALKDFVELIAIKPN
ncbi:MAG: class I SAM-dependent methyltransferase [Anaerolineae bacterium]|nr:class I SAM-dependent methyltransferase [Anaerolineae bacterium]